MARHRSSTHHRAPKADEKPHPAHAPRATRGRPMWSGSISFGLVTIPVKLYSGIRPKDVRFHMLHAKDKSRVQERLFCPAEEKEIPRDEVVKGFEVSKGQHVIVSQEEIDSLAPKASKTIELLNVVDLAQVDPIYFNRPFYLVPEEQATKAYFLLMEALKTAKKGAIAKFVMRNKEYIGAIRPVSNALCLDTLHFADEMVATEDLEFPGSKPHLREAEVKMALQLLESLEADFDPKILHDEYRDQMLDLIQKKAEGQEIVTAPQAAEETPHVIDLMDALKKSVAEAQRQRGGRRAA
jgi:DNA end-binding protein Ku